MYQAVFFDLDGTLLPIDTHAFMRSYFELLGAYFAENGVPVRTGLSGIQAGTKAMFAYDGRTTNQERFWQVFVPFMEDELPELAGKTDWNALLDAFYAERFPLLGRDVEPDPLAARIVDELHERGYRLALTTNPLFPPEATAQRLAWTGVDPDAFERVTAYQNSRYAKPERAYYEENLAALGLTGEQVLMVGNDLVEDGAACACGCGLYLVTDHLVEHAAKDFGDVAPREDAVAANIEEVPHGTMGDLLNYVQSLPVL